jgi:hypothetical protein
MCGIFQAAENDRHGGVREVIMLCPCRIVAFIAAFEVVVVCVPISAQLAIRAKAGLISYTGVKSTWIAGQPSKVARAE